MYLKQKRGLSHHKKEGDVVIKGGGENCSVVATGNL